MVDLRFLPELVWHTGDVTWQEWEPEKGKKLTVKMPDFHKISLSTSISCISGQYTMVGVVSPKNSEGGVDTERKVILYRPPEGQDFATACRWLREWRKSHTRNEALPGNWDDRLLHERDEVRVPYVFLDVRDDLAGELRGGRYYGKPGDPWTVGRAEQRTRFELYEKGARVRVEGSIGLDPFAGKPSTVPRRFHFDRPFFVFLWREEAEWPYLGAWIGDTSALRKF